MVQTPVRPTTLSLELPVELTLTVTDAQFELLAATNPELSLERTAKGELVVNPPTGWETGRRNRSLTGQLDRWYEDHDGLGEAFESSTGFKLPKGATRSPDASWVSRARWDAMSAEQKQETFAPVCPDFVVELRSGSDALNALQEKMREYMDNGARLGWLLDPKNRRVEVYRAGKPTEVLEAPSELSGEDILPDFVLKLHRIWT